MGTNTGSNSQPDPNLIYTTSGTTTATTAAYVYDPNYLSVGSTFYPTSVAASTSGWFTNSCPAHVTNADLIEYSDGVVISYCAVCQARIEISRVPGGMNVLRLKDLVARLIASTPEELSELLGEFADQRNALADERQALEEAAELLRTAEALLKEKSG